MRSRREFYVLALQSVVVAAAYAGGGCLAFAITTSAPGVAAIWPASGIAIAAVVLGGRRLLPAVAVGALVCVLIEGDGLVASLIITAGDVAEAWIAAVLLARVDFRPDMRRINDAVAFCAFAGILATAISALFGVLSVATMGTTGFDNLATIWRDWWLGDMSGVVVVGSLILVASRAPRELLFSWLTVRLVATALVVGALSYVVLDNTGSLPYLALPLLYVLAFVFRQRGTTLGALLVAAAATVLTRDGDGPFTGGGIIESLTRAEVFVTVGSITGLMVAAALSERHAADDARLVADRARAGLQDSEQKLRDAQHLAKLGSFEIDLRSRQATWSDEVQNLIGLTDGPMRGNWSAFRDAIMPDDLEKVDALTRDLYDRSADGSLVHRIVRPDGQVRWMELLLRYRGGEDETIPKHPLRVFGTCQDVTVEVVAEQQAEALFRHAPYAILVVDGGGTIVSSNVPAQQLFAVSADDLAGQPVGSMLHLPGGLTTEWYLEEGDPELEFWGRRHGYGEFPVHVSVASLPTMAGRRMLVGVRDVTRLREETEVLNFHARHDALTGLPNRMMFLEHLDLALARARRSRRPLAVLFADLDDFKLVNDTSGHDVGDMLLADLTERLETAVREGDMVARLGGDEFVVLCEDVGDEAAAVDVAERLVAAVAEPFALGELEHQVGLSVGVMMVVEPEQVASSTVLRGADSAMYVAKAEGKGRVAVFTHELTRGDGLRNLRDGAFKAALAVATSRGELVFHVQPVFALADASLRGFEALVRWRHPSRGLLMPGEFLAVAQDSGDIADVGQWMLDRACRQLAAWRDEFGGRSLRIAVNVSAFELTSTDYAVAVERVLELHGIDPDLLIIELSEATLLRDFTAVERQLRLVRGLGVHLDVDDFGLAEAAVPTLAQLKVSGLKLHGSFVRSLSGRTADETGLRRALAAGASLGAPLVAEHVETWAAAMRLRRAGCELAQGYLFGQPGPPEQLASLIAADRERDAAA